MGNINRKMYKVIKAYDHRQMEMFVQNIHDSAYADGMEAGKTLAEEQRQEKTYKEKDKLLNIRTDEMKKRLLAIKGIGEKKADAVMAAVMEEIKEAE